eukprot:TRINITY_DN5863_c0_g1_i2.p1 TRINITY_DN5863_c0_g1~~TRINITY_DN5863_c0_g1_i2.p1  ORF type:complete len:2928 (-),score=472.60 TRINITY_DN5863_c0_g1_i2:117-8855(-)
MADHVYQPVDGAPRGATQERSVVLEAARNVVPALGIIAVAAACTFLVPALLSAVGKKGPSEVLKAPVVPATSTASPVPVRPTLEPDVVDEIGSEQLAHLRMDLELKLRIRGVDQSMLAKNPSLQQDLLDSVRSSIATEVEVPTSSVIVHIPKPEGLGVMVRARVIPSEGSTAGDLRGRLYPPSALGAAVAKAVSDIIGLRSITRGAIGVGGVEVFMVPSNTDVDETDALSTTPTASTTTSTHTSTFTAHAIAKAAISWPLPTTTMLSSTVTHKLLKPTKSSYSRGSKEPHRLGTALLLSSKNVIYNNLGGQGPGLQEPQELRYGGACLRDGQPVDLVFRVADGSSYSAQVPAFNGLGGHQELASVNLALGTSTQLRLRLLNPRGKSIPIKRLYLSIFDVEEPFHAVSSRGEVSVSGFDTVLWPSGKWLPASALGNGSWTPRRGAAPVFFFSSAQEIEVNLKAQKAEGNSFGGSVAGRTFFFSLHSPTVSKAVSRRNFMTSHSASQPEVAGRPAGVAASASSILGSWHGELGAELLLNSRNVINNNLGGLGPGMHEPPELRYGGVCYVKGDPVDLVISVDPKSNYTPKLPMLNGLGGSLSAASVNLAFGSSVDLNLRFVSSVGAKESASGIDKGGITIDKLYLSVYDLEEPFRALAAPGEVTISGFKEVLWPNGTRLPFTKLSSKAGNGRWAAPGGPAVIFVFYKVAAVKITLVAIHDEGNSMGRFQGRTFLFSLHSPEALGPVDVMKLHRRGQDLIHERSTATAKPATSIATSVATEFPAFKAGSAAMGTWDSMLGTELSLGSSTVIANNLGGHGPGFDEPPELRYGGICRHNGELLDLVISVGGDGAYSPKVSSLNGMGGHHAAASVNLEIGSSVDLQLHFLRSVESGLGHPGDGSATPLEHLFLSVYDIEEPFLALSAPGQVTVTGFNTAYWPNGTILPAAVLTSGKTGWTAPAGLAVFFSFRNEKTIHVKLHAVHSEGNVMNKYEGRTFLFTLFSPDVSRVSEKQSKYASGKVAHVPSTMHASSTQYPSASSQDSSSVAAAVSAAVGTWGSILGTEMLMSRDTLLYNNLGGLGPGKHEPPELRYGGVCLADGMPVDLVIRVDGDSSYKAELPDLNGMAGPHATAASVNLALGSSVDLQLRFVRSSESGSRRLAANAVFLEHLYLSIYDVEEPARAISTAQAVTVWGFKAVMWPNGERLPASSLTDGRSGWSAPAGPAAVFIFRKANTIHVSLKAVAGEGNTLGSYAGRTFFLSFHSPDVSRVRIATLSRVASSSSISTSRGPRAPETTSLQSQSELTAMHASAVAAVSAAVGTWGSMLGTALLLKTSNIVYNNLGGHGPEQFAPPELRYGGVCLVDDTSADLVISVESNSYRPELPELNGMDGHHASASVNLALGSAVDLKLRIVVTEPKKRELRQRDARARPETEKGSMPSEPSASIEHLYLSIFDVEDPSPAISAAGAVAVSGFTSVLWPNGTKMSAASLSNSVAGWSAPAGPAVVFAFHDVESIFVSLKAVASEGNTVGRYAGRTFQLSLHSPDVSRAVNSGTLNGLHSTTVMPAFPHNELSASSAAMPADSSSVAAAVSAAVGTWGSILGTEMLMSRDTLLYNNLGGLGPGKHEPPELRYGGVCLADGMPVDLVIRVDGDSSYKAELPDLNGMAGPHATAASVNLALGSSVDLQLRFVRSSESGSRRLAANAVFLEHLYLSIYDVEEPARAISTAQAVTVWGFKAVMWPNGERLPASSLTDGRSGWSAPAGPAAVFIFRKANTIHVSLKAVAGEGNTLGSYAGRTFFLSFHSPDVSRVRIATLSRVASSSSISTSRGPRAPETTSLQSQSELTAMHASAVAAVSAAVGTWGSMLGTALLLKTSNIVYNNLGGHGPEQFAPPELRYGGVCLVDDTSADLVISVESNSYRPELPELNGMDGHHASASVNLALGSAVDLKLRIVVTEPKKRELRQRDARARPETEKGSMPSEPSASIEHLYLSIFDVEDPSPAISAAGAVAVSGFTSVLWPNGTKMSAASLSNSVAGWSAPAGPAVVFAFHDVESIFVSLKAVASEGNTVGRYAGRTFQLSLHSPDVSRAANSFSQSSFATAAESTTSSTTRQTLSFQAKLMAAGTRDKTNAHGAREAGGGLMAVGSPATRTTKTRTSTMPATSSTARGSSTITSARTTVTAAASTSETTSLSMATATTTGSTFNVFTSTSSLLLTIAATTTSTTRTTYATTTASTIETLTQTSTLPPTTTATTITSMIKTLTHTSTLPPRVSATTLKITRTTSSPPTKTYTTTQPPTTTRTTNTIAMSTVSATSIMMSTMSVTSTTNSNAVLNLPAVDFSRGSASAVGTTTPQPSVEDLLSKEVGLSMKISNLDYEQLLNISTVSRLSFIRGLEHAIEKGAGNGVQTKNVGLSPAPRSVNVDTTLVSSQELNVSHIESALKSSASLGSVILAVSQTKGIENAITGPLGVSRVRAVPLLHSAAKQKSPLSEAGHEVAALRKELGLSRSRFFDVLLFLAFVAALCCVIPLLSRWLYQSWGNARPTSSVARFNDPLERSPGGGFEEAFSQGVLHDMQGGYFGDAGLGDAGYTMDDEDPSLGDAMLSHQGSFNQRSIPPSPLHENQPSLFRPASGSMPPSPMGSFGPQGGQVSFDRSLPRRTFSSSSSVRHADLLGLGSPVATQGAAAASRSAFAESGLRSDPWEDARSGMLPRLVGVQPLQLGPNEIHRAPLPSSVSSVQTVQSAEAGYASRTRTWSGVQHQGSEVQPVVRARVLSSSLLDAAPNHPGGYLPSLPSLTIGDPHSVVEQMLGSPYHGARDTHSVVGHMIGEQPGRSEMLPASVGSHTTSSPSRSSHSVVDHMLFERHLDRRGQGDAHAVVGRMLGDAQMLGDSSASAMQPSSSWHGVHVVPGTGTDAVFQP